MRQLGYWFIFRLRVRRLNGVMEMKGIRRAVPMAGIYLATIGILLLGIFAGDRAVTAMSRQALTESRRCIVIDPGHGGEDGGAVSCTGRAESAYNLEISLRLRDLLQLLGYRVKMVRTEDVSVYTRGETLAQKKLSDLKQRVRITEEAQAALLLSVHQNQFPDSRYSGAQVFHAATEGSRELAQALQSALTETLNPGSRRECKQAKGIYLMERISCPGILVECGFLSNPGEEAKLRDPEYQIRLSGVIAAVAAEKLSNT